MSRSKKAKPKKLGIKHDSTPDEISKRDGAVLKSLRRLGRLRGDASDKVCLANLPDGVSHSHIAKDRKLFHKSVRQYLRPAIEDGQPIYFITVVGPWGFNDREPTGADLQRVKMDMQRGLRKLVDYGPVTALGTVDLSWEKTTLNGVEGFRWEPHAHILADFRPTVGDAKALIKQFVLPTQASPVRSAYRPVVTKLVTTRKDLTWTMRYVSSKLLAECGQRSAGYIDDEGRQKFNNYPLRSKQFDQVIELMLVISPNERWILTGLRRDGGNVRRTSQKKGSKVNLKSLFKI